MRVLSLSRSATHTFSKQTCDTLRLEAGKGIVGDAHFGKTVKHRSRVAKDPTQPNLRQVHLMHSELFDELLTQGFKVSAGMLGENITTVGIDLLSLSCGTTLQIADVELQLTGLRNPCVQLNNFQDGLMNALISKDDAGNLVRKAGVMAIVKSGGLISVGAPITVIEPEGPFVPMDRV